MKFFQILICLLITLKAINVTGQSDFKDHFGKPELDSSIIHGQLSNGLKYYIKPLENYQGKLNLWFYVKAGSYNEDPDQFDFAHFAEHMAFKSSDNFKTDFYNDLKFLQKIGLAFHDFGGHSGPYYTKYFFKVPQGNPEALDIGFRWFGDIADKLHFKDNEIDEERGVMIQEVIFRSDDNIAEASAKRKLLAQLVPCHNHQPDFVAHQKNFDPDRLRQFYKDWYRPDRMAIFAVGKVDNVEELVEHIEKNFSGLKTKPSAREAINCDSLFYSQSDRFAVVVNKGAAPDSKEGAKIKLIFRDPLTLEKISKKEGVQRRRQMNLLAHIINKRLKEKMNYYNSFSKLNLRHLLKEPFAPSSLMLTIESKSENEKKVLQEIFHVLKQVQKYGVLQTEFQEAVEQELIKFKVKNEDKAHYWLTEMEKYLVYEEYFPENKLNIQKNWLTNYELEEFQEFIKGVNLEMPEDIGILAPPGHPVLGYTEGEVRSWIRSVKKESLSPYTPIEVPEGIMTSSEVKKLRERRYKDNGTGVPGTRELVLKNGVNVVLYSFKPSPGPNEKKVFLHGFRKKGALNFPPEDYFSTINAPGFIKNSGLRGLDKFQLQKFLSETSMWWHGIKPYIMDKETGIKADADLEDMETMLQVVYSYFSDPRIDSTAFRDWKTTEILSFHDNKGADINETDLNNYMRKVLEDNSKVLTGTKRFNGLNKTDMKRGFDIYRDLFGSAEDFTFLISGNFSVDTVIPLINKYLGNLPNEKNRPELSNVFECNSLKPNGPVLMKFSPAGALGKTNFTYKPLIIVPDQEHIGWKENLTADALGWVFGRKIIELRFAKKFSLYTANAYCEYNGAEKHLEFGASINCLPEEYPLIRQEYLKMADELKKHPVSDGLFEQGIKRMLVEYDPSGLAGSQEVVQTKLYDYFKYNMPWVDSEKIIPFIKSLTPKDLQLAAQKYFKKENLYEFVMTN